MGKCARGFRRVGNTCRRIKEKVFSIKKLDTRRKRAVQFFVLPFMFFSFILMFVLPDFRVGFLYFAMSLYTLNAFTNKRYREETNGVSFGGFWWAWGIGLGIGFLILSAISPAFSLLTPVLSLSVALSVRILIITIIAPFVEENWRDATLAYLKEHYKNMPRWGRIILSALIFSIIHTTAYGIFLGAFDKWIQLFGAYQAVLGAFLAAFIWGLISAYAMIKLKNSLPSSISHQIINFWLVKAEIFI